MAKTNVASCADVVSGRGPRPRLLVKPGTPEQRNTGTRNTGTPEQHHSGTRNTGTLKIPNLLKFRKKNTGGCESIAVIIIA